MLLAKILWRLSHDYSCCLLNGGGRSARSEETMDALWKGQVARKAPRVFFSILVLGASDANCPWKISEKREGGKQSFLVVANLASSYFDALINRSIFQGVLVHLGTLATQFHKNTTHNIAIVSSFLQDVTHSQTPLQCLYWYGSTFQIFDLGFDWRWCFSNHIFVMAVRATHVECTAVPMSHILFSIFWLPWIASKRGWRQLAS